MPDEPVRFAAIDIGTNSIRMVIARIEQGFTLTREAPYRQMVRLGEGQFAKNCMTEEAIERGVTVCKTFADVARDRGVEEIIALATSAVREADNRDEFIDRVREEAGIEVRVISGKEEARLIWMGVSNGLDLLDKQAVLIDIGGGSTEVVVGNAKEYKLLESMKLGCIRLSNLYFPGANAISSDDFNRARNEVLGAALKVTPMVKAAGFDMMLGSAGTINTLADIISARVDDGQKSATFSLIDLKDTVKLLCKLPLEQRRNVKGMDENRADILLGGAVIIQTLMEEFGADKITVSDRGLREGILLDHIQRDPEAREYYKATPVRLLSVQALATICRYKARHSEHIAFLSRRIFDELLRLGQHEYSADERELLEYAAILHDIGTFLSHTNHHKHAYYLIRNYELLGFDQSEIEMIANLAYFHHRGTPRATHPNLAHLDREDIDRIAVLSSILRLSESLDRNHVGRVQDIRLELHGKPPGFRLTLIPGGDCSMELWSAQKARELFEKVFGMRLDIRVQSD